MVTQPFNRRKVQLHRTRSAHAFNKESFLISLGAERLAERFDDITFTPNSILDIGCYQGQLKAFLTQRFPNASYIHTDFSFALASLTPGKSVVMDEELLPFAPQSFDLIVSNLNLHWVNDLPGALWQIRQCLKPDGLFIASMFGTSTLEELKQSMMHAELELCASADTRISPFIDTKTAGALLQRAGFDIPVADSDIITLLYSDLSELFQDIRTSAQSSALNNSARPLTKTLLERIARYYTANYSYSEEEIKASFELIHLTGFQKHIAS